MKLYLSASFNAKNRQAPDELSDIVKEAGMETYYLARDSDSKYTSHASKELWQKVFDEIGACDGLLIDVSEAPADSRLIEIGIAYAKRMPVIVVKKRGTEHKPLLDGLSEKVVEYTDRKDLVRQLKKFDRDRNFNVTDKTALLIMFLMIGGVIAWVAAEFFVPLAIVGAIVYWMLVRHYVASMRAFDRVVIYIPLAILWLFGLFFLKAIALFLALAWTIIFWFVALALLKKAKLSL